MRRRRVLAAAAAGCTLLAAIAAVRSVSAAPTSSSRKKTARKKTAARPPAPRISAAAQAAALARVGETLAAPPETVFRQPGALVPFFEQLARTGASRQAPLRILHFGDSHTASDDWTGAIRTLLQDRFGNGGSGFSYAGYPFKGYRRFDARGGATPAWVTQGLSRAEGDGLFGLAGVSISTSRAGQSVFLNTASPLIQVFYLRQPRGGRVALFDGEEMVREFSTAGELQPAFIEHNGAPGLRRLKLLTLDARPVRLFGWVAENPTGVTYEAVGINGAEATVMLRWDQAMFQGYLRQHEPALVVLAYGTNEAGHASWTLESYQAAFATVLERIRSAVPAASILVIGPPDRYLRARGKWLPLVSVDRIVEAQQNACRELGCAFWDMRERMGRLGSMRDWLYAGLAQPDYVHFTVPGYQRLGVAFFNDLMAQYEIYKKARQEVPEKN
jgi:hypothetical protein